MVIFLTPFPESLKKLAYIELDYTYRRRTFRGIPPDDLQITAFSIILKFHSSSDHRCFKGMQSSLSPTVIFIDEKILCSSVI